MIGAVCFLTIFGRSAPPHHRDLAWFPVVGAAIGAGVGLTWWGAAQLWPWPVAAALAVIADLIITGLLHMDGLADTADGLLPHLTRVRRLEVMATPDVGAFAVATVAGALLLRWAAVGSLDLDGPSVVVGLAGLWGLSRGLMASAVAVMSYARTEGLARVFTARANRARSLSLIALALGVGVVGVTFGRGLGAGLIAVAAASAAGIAVLALAQRRLGGYTGDVLGAAGVIAEIAGLLALSART